eukprot:COSAG02_NODE_7_length_64539_cov_120.393482_50_plen_86_part_00
MYMRLCVVEWTAGPIPKEAYPGAKHDPEGRTGATGKELVLLFNSGLRSNGTWYADSNGREMVKRERDRRGPNYPPYVVGEPVAGN